MLRLRWWGFLCNPDTAKPKPHKTAKMTKLVAVIVLLLAAAQQCGADALPGNTAVQEFVCVNPMYNCAGHGVCISNGTVNVACKCDSGYVTANCPAAVQCCYKQKSRVLLFLISFFFAFTGAPYFILGATGLGVGILLLCCCGLCCASAGGTVAKEGDNKPASLIACIGCLAFSAAMVWDLALWIMFAAETETVTDKNGVPVAPW